MPKCEDENCPDCGTPMLVIDAVNNLISSIFMTVLTIDQQTGRQDEIREKIGPDIYKWLSDNMDDFLEPGGIDVPMSRLAVFVKDKVEQAIGFQA